MKTIKQASEEFAKRFKHKEKALVYANYFEMGMEFAQQWISVDDELPEQIEKVLVKGNFGLSIGYLESGNVWVGEFNPFGGNIITHWRPIEYKLN